ncbi:hypothetical protein DL764_005482 [Monosporascus ibericus]|uniref:Uncharacterized protein n=1 Tax=Monosporascus ibericus TaxID=155417 RepID=A0A4Q4T8X3_9PEZI|nr:hypothetical protein DL764_005482 [Monosporascus ibericus]
MGAGIAEHYQDGHLRSKDTARTHHNPTRLDGEKMGQRRPGEARRHGYGKSAKEPEQPLLLAGKILEAAGLPWPSDFFIEDAFDEAYPGLREPNCSGSAPLRGERGRLPQAIIRHHRAAWGSPRLKQRWLDDTRRDIGDEFARSLEWQLGGAMFRERGSVEYRCRHPRGEMELDGADTFETIAKYDARNEGRYRAMPILAKAEFPARLRDLREQGREEGEEYLLAAFMTAVALMHELSNPVDMKPGTKLNSLMDWATQHTYVTPRIYQGYLTTDLREPFYGADLEMELGDSFIASLFSAWIPVPIKDLRRPGRALSFDSGIAWRQSLSWDYHRIRPKYRAHHSISVDYVAQLFRDESWSSGIDPLKLIRPQYTAGNSPASRTCFLVWPMNTSTPPPSSPTFAPVGRAGCGTGAPWLDSVSCTYALASSVRNTSRGDQQPRPGPEPGQGRHRVEGPYQTRRRHKLRDWDKDNGLASEQLLEEAPKLRFGHWGGVETLSGERCEISLDELKTCLSQLIDVSFNEFEKLFETPRYD